MSSSKSNSTKLTLNDDHSIVVMSPAHGFPNTLPECRLEWKALNCYEEDGTVSKRALTSLIKSWAKTEGRSTLVVAPDQVDHVLSKVSTSVLCLEPRVYLDDNIPRRFLRKVTYKTPPVVCVQLFLRRAQASKLVSYANFLYQNGSKMTMVGLDKFAASREEVVDA